MIPAVVLASVVGLGLLSVPVTIYTMLRRETTKEAKRKRVNTQSK